MKSQFLFVDLIDIFLFAQSGPFYIMAEVLLCKLGNGVHITV